MISFLKQSIATHTLGYVVLALAVATVMATTVFILARRAAVLRGEKKAIRVVVVAIVAGVGTWTTHFVAMLGFRPDVLLGYDPLLTLASAAIGIIGAVGAIGGFLIPLAFSSPWVASPLTATKGAFVVFLAYYVLCAVVTYAVYLRRSRVAASPVTV